MLVKRAPNQNKEETKAIFTSMFIRTPDTAFDFASSRNSERVTNLPLFLFAGSLWKAASLPKGLTS